MQKNQKIKKLVIPCAGFGTRFLPATKAQSKEMIPILDKPIIQYIVEDAVKSGIEDIILVTNNNKKSIEDHFGLSKELESHLKAQGKNEYLKQIKEISNLANFIHIRQKGPYGNGTPVLDARRIIGEEPFAVVFGDDIYKCPEKPQLKQLIEVYEEYGCPVITALNRKITNEETNKYGVIEGKEGNDDVIKVDKLIEKPGPEKTNSRIASLGGYILTPDIFPILEKLPFGKGGEIWLVDAISELMKKRNVYAKKINGTYCDTGNFLNWLKTNVDFALERDDVKDEFREFLMERVGR